MDEFKVKITRHAGRKFFIMYYDDPDTGKRQQRSTKETHKREALKRAGEWEAELRDGRYKKTTKITWEAFRERFGRERMAALSDKTKAAVESALNHLDGKLAPVRLSQIDSQALSRLQSKMREDGLRETSIACHLRHIRMALVWAVKMRFLKELPEIEMPKLPKGTRHMRGAPISLEQFKLMVAAVPTVRPDDAEFWTNLLWGLWYSGLRLGEAMALSWDRCDLLSVDLSGERPRLRILAEGQKSRKDELLPLVPDCCEWLLSTDPSDRYGKVFAVPLGENGKPYSLDRVSKVISAIGKASGVLVTDETGRKQKHASAHDLRRSFGNRWAPKVAPAVLQKLMRHASITTTITFYVSLDADAMAEELWQKWGVGTFVGTAEQTPTNETNEG